DRPMLALYVLVLGETGGRCKSEVLWLQWDDVHLDDGFLRVVTGRNGHRTKGGKSRWVPMTPRLITAFKRHFARYRFAAYDGTPHAVDLPPRVKPCAARCRISHPIATPFLRVSSAACELADRASSA